ncbi:MAG: M28 family peptidase [Cyclobacteriaceae bacterium]
MKNSLVSAIGLVCLMACTTTNQQRISTNLIDTVAIASHIEVLSSDEYLGRKPFTEGEEKTTKYLKDQFMKMGLSPGNGESYFQEVPMVEITANPSETMTVSGSNGQVELVIEKDYVVFTDRPVDQTALSESEMVFAGYGIVAPEYGWDDYKGLDVKGKTVVVMVNDPGFSSGDSTLFKGETMTYYGRWTYKYEEAARQGAAGILIIHETVPAGYPWMVVRNSWSGAALKLDQANGAYQCDVLGWISRDAAIKVFELSEEDMIGFAERSRSKDFEPIQLGVNVSVAIENTIKRDVSKNVVAKITGSESPDETIIYSAHWDHLGVGPDVDGDSIYNGAYDNASGVAVTLDIARLFKQNPPKRSVMFLLVTAEEQGLLGSAYYASNPIVAAGATVANLNLDGVTPYGAMKDLTVIGYGQSELEDLADSIAKEQNRYLLPDQHPGKGYFFRSDHFSFAKIGIPALFASGSYDGVEGGVERIKAISDAYNQYKYHKPADEYDPSSWRYGSMYQDGQLYYLLGNELANSNIWPKWKDGSEFKSIREGN